MVRLDKKCNVNTVHTGPTELSQPTQLNQASTVRYDNYSPGAQNNNFINSTCNEEGLRNTARHEVQHGSKPSNSYELATCCRGSYCFTHFNSRRNFCSHSSSYMATYLVEMIEFQHKRLEGQELHPVLVSKLINI